MSRRFFSGWPPAEDIPSPVPRPKRRGFTGGTWFRPSDRARPALRCRPAFPQKRPRSGGSCRRRRLRERIRNQFVLGIPLCACAAGKGSAPAGAENGVHFPPAESGQKGRRGAFIPRAKCPPEPPVRPRRGWLLLHPSPASAAWLRFAPAGGRETKDEGGKPGGLLPARRRMPASDFRQFICRKSMEFSGAPAKPVLRGNRNAPRSPPFAHAENGFCCTPAPRLPRGFALPRGGRKCPSAGAKPRGGRLLIPPGID